jgi:hypothetical protein
VASPDPNLPVGGQQHPPVPPPSPGLGGPGYANRSGYLPVGEAGLASPATGSRLGLVAVILGGAALVLELVFAIVQVGLIASELYSVFDLASYVHNFLITPLAVGGIVLGAIALARRGTPKALAGIGLGIGIAMLVEAITSVLYTVVIPLVSR